eukprot:TRINITY_DN4844_c0_g1_i1.p1 TRINITY_DN4844_c0_g1~~TRINITY_DN4844_c0_g1_i1.p1  ORF type:complete len:489 (-),score=98.17 TRINITY_DN4844_c0_g1_i1:20-1486(-)
MQKRLFIACSAVLLVALIAGSDARRVFQGRLNEGIATRVAQGTLKPSTTGKAAQWFTQPLDHTGQFSSASWQQKYYVNADFWGGNGSPVFFFLGGEGPLRDTSVTGHFIIYELAQQWKALIVACEHRFYGESQPTGDLRTSNLRFLTSQQALADANALATFIKSSMNASNSKFIVMGGSYSGALAAWARQMYPSTFHMAWAASAPVHAQVDFYQYYEVTANSLGSACTGAIRNAVQTAETLLGSQSGRNTLEQTYSTCESFTTSPLDYANFMMSISDSISGVVQYSGDNTNYQPFAIDQMCAQIAQGQPTNSVPQMIMTLNRFGGSNCTEVAYATAVSGLAQVDPKNPNAAGRAWTWQTCNEFGYFQTGSGSNIPFSKLITLEYYTSLCRDVFGVEPVDVQLNVRRTNAFYGSRGIAQKASKIIFSNGSVDQWHALGVTSTNSTSNLAVFITGTAHCADIYPPSPSDLPSLTAARGTIITQLKQWLSQ